MIDWVLHAIETVRALPAVPHVIRANAELENEVAELLGRVLATEQELEQLRAIADELYLATPSEANGVDA